VGRQTLFPRNASKSFALLRHHPSYTPSDKTHLMSLANRCSRGAMFLVDFSLPPSLPPSLSVDVCDSISSHSARYYIPLLILARKLHAADYGDILRR
jgi:hypothetical protein